MPNEKRVNAKKLILDTAAKIFAEKGFDGARVDEIAMEAGMSKSLIYYHFKGKEDLLKELSNEFVYEYEKILSTASTQDNANNKYISFLMKNSNILRVLLIESLKKQTKAPEIFIIVEKLLDFMKKSCQVNFNNYENEQKRMVLEFFTSMLPHAFFISYKDKWCQYFNISQNELLQYFTEAIQQTHGKYHES